MIGQPDAMEVYNSFFCPEPGQKSRVNERLVSLPRNPPTGCAVWVGPPSSQDDGYWTSTMAHELEAIVYSRRGRELPNTCHHSFSRSMASAIGDLPRFTLQYLAGIPVADEVPQVAVEEACGPYRPSTVIEIGWDPSDRSKALGDAITRVASEGFKTMMNLPQAIIELKDTRQTAQQLGHFLSWGRGVLSSRNSSRALKHLIRHGSLKEVARMYLATVFGIKPTVGDVQSFLKQIPARLELSGRVVDYKKDTRVRASFTLGGGTKVPMFPPTSWHSTGTKVGSRYRRWSFSAAYDTCGATSSTVAGQGVTDASDWPYGSQLAYRVASLQGVAFGRVAEDVTWNDPVSAMDDILAQAPPALTLWELTPFSFVIDWFADVSGWMRRTNRIQWAREKGLRLQDGVWLGERSTHATYWPSVTQSVMESYRRLWAAGEQIAYSFSAMTVKTVTHSLIGLEGTYDRRGLGDIRLPTIDVRGLRAQGMFQAATGLALCLG